VERAGLAPTPETSQRTFEALCELGSEALFSMANAGAGAALLEAPSARMLLGILATARWYEARNPGALIISLDEPGSRRWLLGAEAEQQRGVLVAVRGSADGVVLEALEVSAPEEEERNLLNEAGLEGRLATEIDQSVRGLRKLFAPAPDALTLARKNILR